MWPPHLQHPEVKKNTGNPPQTTKKKITRRKLIVYAALVGSVITGLALLCRVIKHKVDKAFNDGYSSGHEDGRKEGYKHGYKSGTNVSNQNEYLRGYTKGLEKGKLDSYTKGHDDGYTKGFKKALNPKTKVIMYKNGIHISPNSPEGTKRKLNSILWAANTKTKELHDTYKNEINYDPDDVLKTIDSCIEKLENRKVDLDDIYDKYLNRSSEKADKDARANTELIMKKSYNDSDLEKLKAYKEILSIAKSLKMISGKIENEAIKTNTKIPKNLKEKINKLY